MVSAIQVRKTFTGQEMECGLLGSLKCNDCFHYVDLKRVFSYRQHA